MCFWIIGCQTSNLEPMPTPNELLIIAEAAAARAAEIQVAKYHDVFTKGEDLSIQTKSSDTDFVTETDAKCQEDMIAIIQDAYPDHRFIAEETGADSLGSSDSPYEWIIDPLDGTNNFIHGKPNFGTCVAVQKDGVLEAGVMIMPMVNHHFSAAKGGGALVNGKPVKLRNTGSMNDSILSCNIMRRAVEHENGAWYASMPFASSVENYGCAAQEMGEMLLGWNDGAFFKGIRIWDIAPGCLMMEEAGGKYRYEWEEPGNPRGGLLVVASTPPIFDELCDFVFEKKLT